ncbi:hypothetical protein EV379_2598 [Microterricola gilva]|uniref:Uncharacterized protein n=1 Tax=Microterricola gilva TaxID=393267 RepID=A0A4V6MGJ8_9MICO|nr:hypothetical protein [Microterricola gilva]RZU66246.1 hypothetical protein EV379_2598 [Microterricola gilva]
MRATPFPTRVILMAEYTVALPLWDRSPSPEKWFGPFEPGMLGLPAALEDRLGAWNRRFETAMDSDFEWPSDAARLTHLVDGHLLAAELQRALHDRALVLYLDDGSPAAPVPGIIEQIRLLSEEAVGVLARDIDMNEHRWTPGRAPSRVLLTPSRGGLPLVDRSPLIGMTDDRLDAHALGLPSGLVARMVRWSERWTGAGGIATPGLVDGHLLAAEIQAAVGAGVEVLFPEAGAARSAPSPELLAVADRIARLER